MRCNEVHLNCGIKMPLIGFGTYSFPNVKKKTELAVQNALEVLRVFFVYLYLAPIYFIVPSTLYFIHLEKLYYS